MVKGWILNTSFSGLEDVLVSWSQMKQELKKEEEWWRVKYINDT